MAGACGGHSVGSPYRVLRSYVFDDNAEILGQGSPRSRTSSVSTNSDSSEYTTTRSIFSGRVVPTLYIPGHGYILPPAPRPSNQRWDNPREYWRSRQRVSSTGQLSALARNPSLSVISEESGSMAGSTRVQPERSSSPAVRDSRQNLLEDIHRNDDSGTEA